MKFQEQKHGEYEDGENIKITRVNIFNQEGAEALGKPIGTYVTIDVKNLKIASEEEIENIAINIKKELVALMDKHIRKTRTYFGCWARKSKSNTRFFRAKSNTGY